MREKPTLSDHRVENIIGNLLRIGVIVAASIVAAGGAFYLYRRAGVISNYGSFRGSRLSWSTSGRFWLPQRACAPTR